MQSLENIWNICRLVVAAFLGCVGMTFIILACAVPEHKKFYPMFVLVFYVLSIIPIAISNRITPPNETNAKTEFALFLCSGMVLSSFALPIVLARSSVVRNQIANP